MITQSILSCLLVLVGAWLLFKVAGCVLRLLVFVLMASAVLGVLVR